MIHYTTSDARKNLSDIINKVKYEKIIIGVGRHKKTEVLIIPNPQIIENDIPINQINASSPSFDFLKEEPDLYSSKDIKKRYV